jgi:hypothetical protein
MPTVGAVQRRIEKVEVFKVRFKHLNGTDVKDNKQNIPQYPYSAMARNAWTVSYWKSQRFNPNYPGFRIDVLLKDGSICNGNYLLWNVRDSYLP